MIASRTKCGMLMWLKPAAFAAALAMVPGFVRADVQVRGSLQSVRIEARDSTLAEVLAGLDMALHVRYRTAVMLDNRLNGTYEGPLASVIKRLLEGYNFFVRRTGGETEVTVIGLSTATVRGTDSYLLRRSGPAPDADKPVPEAVEPQAPPGAAPTRSPQAMAALERGRSGAQTIPFRKRHRAYVIAGAAEAHPPPRSIRMASHARHKGRPHPRSVRLARVADPCCGTGPFVVMTWASAYSPGHDHRYYRPRSDVARTTFALMFDRPRRWPRPRQSRLPGMRGGARSPRAPTPVRAAACGSAPAERPRSARRP